MPDWEESLTDSLKVSKIMKKDLTYVLTKKENLEKVYLYAFTRLFFIVI